MQCHISVWYNFYIQTIYLPHERQMKPHTILWFVQKVSVTVILTTHLYHHLWAFYQNTESFKDSIHHFTYVCLMYKPVNNVAGRNTNAPSDKITNDQPPRQSTRSRMAQSITRARSAVFAWIIRKPLHRKLKSNGNKIKLALYMQSHFKIAIWGWQSLQMVLTRKGSYLESWEVVYSETRLLPSRRKLCIPK